MQEFVQETVKGFFIIGLAKVDIFSESKAHICWIKSLLNQLISLSNNWQVDYGL